MEQKVLTIKRQKVSRIIYIMFCDVKSIENSITLHENLKSRVRFEKGCSHLFYYYKPPQYIDRNYNNHLNLNLNLNHHHHHHHHLCYVSHISLYICKYDVDHNRTLLIIAPVKLCTS